MNGPTLQFAQGRITSWAVWTRLPVKNSGSGISPKRGLQSANSWITITFLLLITVFNRPRSAVHATLRPAPRATGWRSRRGRWRAATHLTPEPRTVLSDTGSQKVSKASRHALRNLPCFPFGCEWSRGHAFEESRMIHSHHAWKPFSWPRWFIPCMRSLFGPCSPVSVRLSHPMRARLFHFSSVR